MKGLLASLFAGVLIIATSCTEKRVETPTCGFDVLSMQRSFHEAAILRLQQAKDLQAVTLSKANKFNSNPTADNLIALQEASSEAYLAYQGIASLDIEGSYTKRSTNFFGNWLNGFPAGSDSLDYRLNFGPTSMDAASELVAGYPAEDYVLYGFKGSFQERLSFYQNNDDARFFLFKLAQFNLSFINEINTYWVSQLGEFHSNTGTSNGDPLSLFINAVIKDFEFLKNFKLKNPIGRFNAGNPRPEFAEAYYSQHSFELAYENYKRVKEWILGESQEVKVPLINYVNCIDQNTANSIRAQFQVVDALWEELEPFGEGMFIEPAPQETTNKIINEMQKLTPLLKAEMTSKLNISITYQDNDGD